MADYIWLIPVFPATGFLINAFFGQEDAEDRRLLGGLPCALFASFCVSAAIFFQFLNLPADARVFEKNVFDWIVSGELIQSIGFRIDALSIIMCLVVTRCRLPHSCLFCRLHA